MINFKKKKLNKKKKSTKTNINKSNNNNNNNEKTCNGRFKKKNCKCSGCNSKKVLFYFKNKL